MAGTHKEIQATQQVSVQSAEELG